MGVNSEMPVVSFSRGGQSVTLARGTEEGPLLHLHGSQGLGLPPAQIASSPRLAGHGSVVRGVRYGSREVFIPLLMEADDAPALDEYRRELYELLAPDLGPVEVRVQTPTSDRYITGYLKDGMTGDFGPGFHGAWQTLGLTFECPDPWWMGPDQVVEMQVAPGVKPFISKTVPFFPVILSGSVVQGEFDVEIASDAPVRPVWEVTGPGTDLTITNGRDWLEVGGAFPAGQTVVLDGRSGQMRPDRWATTSLRSQIFELRPGRQTLTVALTGATPDAMVRLTYRERWRYAT